MSRSKIAQSSASPSAIEAQVELYAAAVAEIISAVLGRIAEGKRPERSHQTGYSIGSNGMPSLSDGWYARSGPPTYSSLLDPPREDAIAAAIGRYPSDRFPAVAALMASTGTLPAFGEGSGEFAQNCLKMQLEAAVDAHLNRWGETAATPASARHVSLPPVRALMETDLDIALIAPIALTRFDFRSLRLGPNLFVMKMSPDLQRARWSVKAYGAKGHDSVLAAATHAFVVTRWRIENYGYFKLTNSLSTAWENSTEELDRVFAAFRLVTGIDTGYAQELRLARGWRSLGQAGQPEVFAAPARKYPDAFDHFSWTRDDIPCVTHADMLAVRDLLRDLEDLTHPRLGIAMRRLNAAATRSDPADAILDAVIGLEVLLGDKNNQSISWKLRMRAASLVGLEADRAEMQSVYDNISTIYAERSAIVHGLKRKPKAPKTDEVRPLAVGVLRRIMTLIVRNPRFLDPLLIDQELMLSSQMTVPTPGVADTLSDPPPDLAVDGTV